MSVLIDLLPILVSFLFKPIIRILSKLVNFLLKSIISILLILIADNSIDDHISLLLSSIIFIFSIPITKNISI